LEVKIFIGLLHRRSQGGAEGAIAPPKIPKKYIFNKKVAPDFTFLPRSLLGRLTAAIAPPPKNSAPPRQIPGYAYGLMINLM